MSLWAMGDFHLAFTVDKPMEVFDPVWKDHEKKIWKYVRKSDCTVQASQKGNIQ